MDGIGLKKSAKEIEKRNFRKLTIGVLRCVLAAESLVVAVLTWCEQTELSDFLFHFRIHALC